MKFLWSRAFLAQYFIHRLVYGRPTAACISSCPSSWS